MPDKPMAVVAVAFAIGIVLADNVSPIWIGLALVSILAVGYFALPTRLHTTLPLILLLTAGGACRYWSANIIAADDISRYASKVQEFEGRVVSDVTGMPGYVRMILKVDRAKYDERWRPVSGRLMLNLYSQSDGEIPQVGYGDRLRITTRLYLPPEPSNPGTFSWKNYLARQGIYSCAYVYDPSLVKTLRRCGSKNIVGAALAAKQYLVRSINRVHPAREASVMAGVVLGTYAYLDDDVLLNFQRSGTLHIVAASGYNCFIILLLATPVLKLFRIAPTYRGLWIIALIVFYVMMVGTVPSMTRAAIMSILLLLAAPLGRVADYRNLFFVAAFILMLYKPSNLFDIGFQLSFLAVWALIWAGPILESVLSKSSSEASDDKPHRNSGLLSTLSTLFTSRLPRELLSVTIATVAISLVTAPVIAYYFNYISLVCVPANLAVVFAVPVIFIDSLLSALTALIPHGAEFAGAIGTMVTRAMLWSVCNLGSMKYGAVSVQSPGVLWIAGYYIILYAAMSYVRMRYAAR